MSKCYRFYNTIEIPSMSLIIVYVFQRKGVLFLLSIKDKKKQWNDKINQELSQIFCTIINQYL